MVLHDISVPISPSLPVFPGDPPIRTEEIPAPADGKPFRITRLSFGSHTGTHIDSPAHLLEDGMKVDEIPLETLIGHCRVIDLVSYDGEIDDALLKKLPLRGERRLLFRTRNSALWQQPAFVHDFSALTPEAASFLVEIGVRLIGIDYLSIEHSRTRGEVHRILLEAGVVILEGLNLAAVERGDYELICLPLRITGSEGAPCRAVLRGRPPTPAEPGHHLRWPP